MSSTSKKLTEIEQLRAQLAAKEAELQSQSARITILEEVVRHLKLKRFAPSSEKTSADQFLLFDESELCTDPDLTAFENEQANKSTQGDNDTQPRGRKPLSKDLPREQIFLYLTDEEKTGAKSTFFAKVKGCSSFQTTVHYPLMLLGRYSNAALIAAYETASSHQSRHWTLTSELLKGLRRHLAPILLLLYRGGH